MSKVLQSALIGAALMSATPGQAQEAPTIQRPVAVAVVDISADKLTTEDAKVRFIDLTPAPPEGRAFAKSRNMAMDHGDYVASAFVQEYRKMDADSPIDIYSINPFLQKNSRMAFNRKTITDAIPTLKANGVKVVITAFGMENKEAGEAIVNDFAKAGMVVFAAIPNSISDEGIYPAASRNAISVGDDNGRYAPLAKRKDWANWVNFSIDGEIKGVHGSWEGASFSSGKAAAYGVRLAQINPEITVDGMRQAMAKYSQPSIYGQVRLIGEKGMVEAFSYPMIVKELASLKPAVPEPSEEKLVATAQVRNAASVAAATGMGM